MDIIFDGFTDPGLIRTVNQDSMLMLYDRGLGIFAVADGMGGHEHGEKASKAITDALRLWHENIVIPDSDDGFVKIIESLSDTVKSVNNVIRNMYDDAVCGSTLVAVCIWRSYYAVLSVGDSHVYIKSGFGFRMLSRDDIWENDPANVAGMSEKQIKADPRAGKLISAIGVFQEVIPNILTGTIKKKDVFILCCDGIYRTCSERQIRHSAGKAAAGKTIGSELEHMKGIAYSKGAPDNITMVYIFIS